MALLRRLKAAPESFPSAELAAAMSSTPSRIRPSTIQTSRSVSPITTSGMEFELQVLHPSAYPSLEPLDLEAIDVGSWFSLEGRQPAVGRQTTPARLQSPTGERKKNDESADSSTSRTQSSSQPTTTTSSPTQQSLRIGSFVGEQLCDARLRDLRMSYWSSIPIDDSLAAGVFSHFLTVHFPIYPCFDAGLFLDDLVGQKVKHCSPFLVAGILSIACVRFCLS